MSDRGETLRIAVEYILAVKVFGILHSGVLQSELGYTKTKIQQYNAVFIFHFFPAEIRLYS